MVEVVSVTKKGQATIPKKLRKKYGIKDKVGHRRKRKRNHTKTSPSLDEDFGSLKSLFKGKTAKELLEESRIEELFNDKERLKRAGALNIRL